MIAATMERWWAVSDEEAVASKSSEEAGFALAMDALVSDHSGEASLPAFLGWLRREATSQEMYGESLYADPTLLEPMYDAFDAGWRAREYTADPDDGRD